MKKIFKTLIFLGLVASTTSCKKYLDINTSPNSLTAAAPDLILPQALVATGTLTYSFSHTYGGDLGGYIANSGGVGGYGNFWTFVFNAGDFNGLWTGTYDNLADYQFVIDNTTPTGDLKYFNAVARVMKSFDFLRLVDAYGDVPYSQALKGAGNLTPVYDKGQDVYKACITELDAAIAIMNSAPTSTTKNIAANSNGPIDVMVYSTNTTNNKLSYNSDQLKNGFDMTNWIKFANTIKLRALIRIQKADVTTFNSFKASMASLTTANFISADVMVNPGYLQQSGKQNPFWNGFAFTNAGVANTPSYLATKFVMGFYNGNKLTDDGRGKLIYRAYTYANQLGFQSTNSAVLPTTPPGSAWYVGVSGGGAPTGTSANGYGVLKGFDQGIPLITAAESYYLQAEAAMIGLITGSPSDLFNSGLLASFNYLHKDHTEIVSNVAGQNDPAVQIAAYKEFNSSRPKSYLVNFSTAWVSTTTAYQPYVPEVPAVPAGPGGVPAAVPAVPAKPAVPGVYVTRPSTAAEQLEAIITQKYIALNMINNDEGWNEYRRTLYPVSIPPSQTAGSADPVFSFAPAPATITTPRSDGLAGRVIYPASETSYNKANVPAVDGNTTLIFWDARPKN